MNYWKVRIFPEIKITRTNGKVESMESCREMVMTTLYDYGYKHREAELETPLLTAGGEEESEPDMEFEMTREEVFNDGFGLYLKLVYVLGSLLGTESTYKFPETPSAFFNEVID